ISARKIHALVVPFTFGGKHRHRLSRDIDLHGTRHISGRCDFDACPHLEHGYPGRECLSSFARIGCAACEWNQENLWASSLNSPASTLIPGRTDWPRRRRSSRTPVIASHLR